jgi:hypothetical protein
MSGDGNPTGADCEGTRSRPKGKSVRANARAVAPAPVLAEIKASGITGPYAIAVALSGRGIRTPRGHRYWMASQVRTLLDRFDRLGAGDCEP